MENKDIFTVYCIRRTTDDAMKTKDSFGTQPQYALHFDSAEDAESFIEYLSTQGLFGLRVGTCEVPFDKIRFLKKG